MNKGVVIVTASTVVLGGTLAILLSQKAKAAPPEEGEEGQAKFYMPETLQVSEAGPVDGLYTVTFSTRITNRGNAPGRYQLTWGSNELGPGYAEEASRIIELEPGKSYDWSWSWPEIHDYYRGYFTVWLFGDWEGDNAAFGVWL